MQKIYSDTVSGEIIDTIAVVTIDNPPINAIYDSIRDGLVAACKSLNADDAVAAIVLRCAGSTFIAGVDIKKTQQSKAAFDYSPALKAMDGVNKPLIAALHGTALGGGLETALMCHYRIALASAKFGLPEVNLGIIPGAGGTQRLPRLVGFEAGVDMIISGKPVKAEQALQMGLIDRIVEGDDLQMAAIDYAKSLVSEKAPLRRLRDTEFTDEDIEAASQQLIVKANKIRRNELAPLRAIEAAKVGALKGFDAGQALESEFVESCKNSPQGRALRSLFLAERLVNQIPGVDKETKKRDVSSAGVIGAGTMGRGIVVAMVNAGIKVTLVDAKQEALDNGMQAIDTIYAGMVKKGRMSESGKTSAMAMITPALSIKQLSQADLVVEAVFEDLGLKQSIFKDLDKHCKPGAILASNTSALDMDKIASATARPDDVVGMHFFSPAHIMPLVEIIRGEKTSLSTLASASSVLKKMRKVGVIAGNCDGFIGNRMLRGYLREAGLLLLEGASPQQIDAAVVAFGMPMGPFTMLDMAGLDVSAAGRARRRAEGKITDERDGLIADKLVEMGRHGQKTQRGFYRYEAGSRTAIPDEEVMAIATTEAERLGIAQRNISDEEIVQRCIYPLINEACNILEEGMALRASDIDVIYCNGYGFPRYRGGPMCYAEEVGLSEVLKTLNEFAETYGPEYWTASPLLIRLVDSKQRFADLF